MTIHLVRLGAFDGDSLPYEHVERKGVGHPDTLSDAIAEHISRYYSQHCLGEFTRVAHHWFDKVMILGGESDVDFGRGKLIQPYRVIVAGKAARSVGERGIPLQEIIEKACSVVLTKNLSGFDPAKDLIIEYRTVSYRGTSRSSKRYRPASVEDLASLDSSMFVSNDCTLLSAFAPLSETERLTLEVEKYINGPDFKARFSYTGWDVKVFATRVKEEIQLTINLPIFWDNT